MVDSELEEGELPEVPPELNNINDVPTLPAKRVEPETASPDSPVDVSAGKPYKKLPCKYFAVGTCHRGEK
jgi:hypothetical protein